MPPMEVLPYRFPRPSQMGGAGGAYSQRCGIKVEEVSIGPQPLELGGKFANGSYVEVVPGPYFSVKVAHRVRE